MEAGGPVGHVRGPFYPPLIRLRVVLQSRFPKRASGHLTALPESLRRRPPASAGRSRAPSRGSRGLCDSGSRRLRCSLLRPPCVPLVLRRLHLLPLSRRLTAVPLPALPAAPVRSGGGGLTSGDRGQVSPTPRSPSQAPDIPPCHYLLLVCVPGGCPPAWFREGRWGLRPLVG